MFIPLPLGGAVAVMLVSAMLHDVHLEVMTNLGDISILCTIILSMKRKSLEFPQGPFPPSFDWR